MPSDALPGGVDGMAVSRTRRPFSDRLTSRGGAWISLGLVLLIMVALFGVAGSAKAPARNDQAPAGAESTQTSELLGKFPNADRQSVLVVASRDDGDRLDGRGIQTLQVAQAVVLVVGDRRTDLLDREHAPGQLDEAHHVARDAAWERREPVLRPILQGQAPRQVEKCRIRPGSGDIEGHDPIVPSRSQPR